MMHPEGFRPSNIPIRSQKLCPFDHVRLGEMVCLCRSGGAPPTIHDTEFQNSPRPRVAGCAFK